MFCSRCGQVLAENDRFCPKCGQKIEESQGMGPASPVSNAGPRGQEPPSAPPVPPASQNGQPPLSYPYQPPAGAPVKKKNPWLVPVIVVVAVLVLALIIVGGILGYTIYRTIKDDQTSAPVTSQAATLLNERELSGFLGQTVEDLKNGTGVPLFFNDDAYTNLDGSVTATLDDDGYIDMLIISDRDVGFTICGVSVGMNQTTASAAARAAMPDLEEYGDMLIGQDGENHFAAYFDESGKVYYVIYFISGEESSGTNASIGTGIWYLGESLQTVWDYFGDGYQLLPAPDATDFFYMDEGFSFVTQDTAYTGQSVVSSVWMYQNAWFSDEIYIGMDYYDISLFVDLSEIYQNPFTGAYQADFSMLLDGWECYGYFTFEGPGELSRSTEAYIVRG